MIITDYSKGDNLRKEAKALRAKARRLEAKGTSEALLEAMSLRDQADGCRYEALWSDQNGGR